VEALRPLAGDARIVGAGRTDAGVHALGQVATVAGARPLAPATVQAALNARLPRDIRVLDARLAPDGFDARRSAWLKRYGYLLATGRVASPFLRRYAWHLGRPLDVRAIAEGLAVLRGRHDFSAFCAAAGRGRSPVCDVRSLRVVAQGAHVGILVSADSFLHHMMRTLVGTAVEVGLGRRPPAWVAEVLTSRDRRQAGPTAPAHGLGLLTVRYRVPLFPGRGRRPASHGRVLPPDQGRVRERGSRRIAGPRAYPSG
jgi:tRNA pseudouridine38-40 synthase